MRSPNVDALVPKWEPLVGRLAQARTSQWDHDPWVESQITLSVLTSRLVETFVDVLMGELLRTIQGADWRRFPQERLDLVYAETDTKAELIRELAAVPQVTAVCSSWVDGALNLWVVVQEVNYEVDGLVIDALHRVWDRLGYMTHELWIIDDTSEVERLNDATTDYVRR